MFSVLTVLHLARIFREEFGSESRGVRAKRMPMQDSVILSRVLAPFPATRTHS
jgi:hypothetical protein